MKRKILSLTALILIATACSTKKTAVAETPPVGKEIKATELTPELAEGKNLYENNCAKCHKLFEPKKFTKEEWTPILVKMGKKAKLDETQMVSITNYIDSQL
ncbi:cytochrome c [Flavobacterium humidisoli]|uniref:Cytochrome c n=1 Tax=Flavobacterium humidisoli TaxID=2937442 RepID=A0ABY4LNV9_9FLAO|nr:cytochrome c [Flavobacterium humidisoli]UPZ13561.1 cytochrome c [Flavobacterium humidisoli]